MLDRPIGIEPTPEPWSAAKSTPSNRPSGKWRQPQENTKGSFYPAAL